MTRAALVRQLSQERDPAVLGAHLRDPAWQVRWEAIESLKRAGSPAAEPYLLEVLREPVDPDDLPFANSALGVVGTKAAVPALTALIHHAKQDVQASAIHALMELGDSSLTPVYLDALSDRSSAAKHYAMEALARHGDERAVGPVIVRVRAILGRDRRQNVGGWTELMHALTYLARWQHVDEKARDAIAAVPARWERLSDAERRWYAATFPDQVPEDERSRLKPGVPPGPELIHDFGERSRATAPRTRPKSRPKPPRSLLNRLLRRRPK